MSRSRDFLRYVGAIGKWSRGCWPLLVLGGFLCWTVSNGIKAAFTNELIEEQRKANIIQAESNEKLRAEIRALAAKLAEHPFLKPPDRE